MRRFCGLLVVFGGIGCQATPDVQRERTPAAGSPAASAVVAAPAPALASLPLTLPWESARTPTSAERRSMRAFYATLEPSAFRDHFRAPPPTSAQALADRQALSKRVFLYQVPVEVSQHRQGVYLDEDGDAPVLRWVWPLDLGDGIHLIRHKPRVNAGTGVPQLRSLRTWLMDVPRDSEVMRALRERPKDVRLRALWQIRGARTERYPTLVVRIMAWQLLVGDDVLRQETDDR